jgi:Carboxypeptidase regulatory-like domain
MRRYILALALLFCATAAHAQQTGQIFGKVSDTSGGVMPGVTVTASSPVLLQPLVAITSETGTYQFSQVPIGVYTVTFELVGFNVVTQPNVRIEIGFSAQVNAKLTIGAVQETINVSASSPIIDLRDTGKTNRFNAEALQALPSARDPWVIIEQSAGVAMDRANVGGSMSGQQSNFVARGSLMSQQKWNLDGVDITDMSATGGSPVYFDFDAFEEMQISTGGNDVSMQSPGVAVNLVTKSGTDVLRGSSRGYITDQKFESVNLTDTLRRQGATSGNPIQNIKDYGVEAGGPISKGRAWIWGSYGRQAIKVGVNGFYQSGAGCQTLKSDLKTNALSHSINDIWDCLNTDLTTLSTSNLKFALQASKMNQLSFFFNAAGKERNARDASDTRPIETTYRQGGVEDSTYGSSWWKTGVPKTYKWSDRHIFNDRFLIELQYAHVGNNFVLDFHEPSLASVQASYDENTGMYGRSYQGVTYVRPTDSVDVTANYFLPGTLGGDNSLKFGVKIRNDEALSATHYGGNAWAVYANGTPVEAWIFRDGLTDYGLRNRSAYAQDTWARGKVTINAGLRWDYQTDLAVAATVPGVPFVGQTTRYGQVFNQLPQVTFAGADAGLAWKNFSPRAGLSYDFAANGRTIAKFNYSRYVNQLGTGNLSSTYNPVKVIELDYPWADLNGDATVQANEIDLRGAPLFATSGYNYNNPTLLTTTGQVDPNLTAPKTDEAIVTLDKQLATDFAVSASYIYRKYTNFTWTSRPGMTSADWTAKTFTPTAASCPAGSRCQPVTYYAPNFQLPVGTLFTNQPDYYREYNGVELSFRKRMSNRWLTNGSYSFNSAPQHYPTPASYLDPDNITTVNGGQYAQESTSSGLDNVFVNASWIFRLSGSYTVPVVNTGVAAFYNARSGYPFEAAVRTGSRGNGAAADNILLETPGDVRLPTFQQLDLRVDKTVALQGHAKILASVDMFNLFNSNTIMAQRRTQNASNANQIANILAPRVLRFGVRLTF